jgi:site-specific DNA-methyltransferase (adenine-specific)
MNKPYYHTPNISLYEGDAHIVLPELAKNGVMFDAVITDPPYGTTAIGWDKTIDFWPYLRPLVKPTYNAILFGNEPFCTTVRADNLADYKYDIIWVKNTLFNFFHAKNRPLEQFEQIMVFSGGKMGHASLLGDKRMTYNPQKKPGKPYFKKDYARSKGGGHRLARPSHKDSTLINNGDRYPSDVVFFDRDNIGKVLHPTQKPVALMEYLVLTFTNPGDLVLDFTMGSGTTGVACVKHGRRFVGIELKPEYCPIALDRIRNAAGEYGPTVAEEKAGAMMFNFSEVNNG